VEEPAHPAPPLQYTYPHHQPLVQSTPSLVLNPQPSPSTGIIPGLKLFMAGEVVVVADKEAVAVAEVWRAVGPVIRHRAKAVDVWGRAQRWAQVLAGWPSTLPKGRARYYRSLARSIELTVSRQMLGDALVLIDRTPMPVQLLRALVWQERRAALLPISPALNPYCLLTHTERLQMNVAKLRQLCVPPQFTTRLNSVAEWVLWMSEVARGALTGSSGDSLRHTSAMAYAAPLVSPSSPGSSSITSSRR
jgi:hypothetical protein